MKGQEHIHNDGSNFQSYTLTDLPVADAQADETKGGPAAARWSQIITGVLPAY